MTFNCNPKRVSSSVACYCTAGALALSVPVKAEPAPTEPVLVELFTSQNCPACPAANEKLISLAEAGEVFPLTWSVSYWDYLGWKDSFAKPEFNQRQRDYAETFNLRGPYTPQAVVDGCVQTTGKVSSKKVKEKLDAARAPHGPVIDYSVDFGSITLQPGKDLPEVDVLLVGYLPGITAVIPDKGLNKKKMLSHVNMVTSLTPIGTWNGDISETLEFTCRDEACVVLIQEDGTGDILGYAKVPGEPTPQG